MPATENSSSLPGERLISVPLTALRPHPANANVMAEELLAKLAENINRQGDYPPLVVRPHPDDEGSYQILDGHQRCEVLRRLGRDRATCYVWPCDDQTALILVATLNRLEGQDDPRLRAELIGELAKLASIEELAVLLPEDQRALEDSLSLIDLDLDQLLEDLQRGGQEPAGLRSITFAVTPEEEAAIEEAVHSAIAGLEGKNLRGRGLAMIANHYLEGANE
jgi:ParB-like chromosome segregation protein Spo0J